MTFYRFVFQDCIARNPHAGCLKYIQQYVRIPAYRIFIRYRLCQYLKEYRGGVILTLSRLLMERICGKYCVTLSDGLNAGEGLAFPHNGPFVINPGAVIGKYCTIHPQVLIGGDRRKGAPRIGDYVFIGNGAKVIGNAKIGNWVFISPGAIVTKDVPDGRLVGAGLNNILNNDGRKHVEMYLL